MATATIRQSMAAVAAITNNYDILFLFVESYPASYIFILFVCFIIINISI